MLSRYLLIYGRRRVILSLLIAFLIGLIFRQSIFINYPIDYIGFIIPGLIANWMDRQGIIRTTSVILITASIVHLILMLLYREVFKYTSYVIWIVLSPSCFLFYSPSPFPFLLFSPFFYAL